MRLQSRALRRVAAKPRRRPEPPASDHRRRDEAVGRAARWPAPLPSSLPGKAVPLLKFPKRREISFSSSKRPVKTSDGLFTGLGEEEKASCVSSGGRECPLRPQPARALATVSLGRVGKTPLQAATPVDAGDPTRRTCRAAPGGIHRPGRHSSASGQRGAPGRADSVVTAVAIQLP